MRALDLTGQRFGRLVVRGPAAHKGRKRQWKCVCDCGCTSDAGTANLRSGMTKSCGCLQRERTSAAKATHGRTNTVEHIIWRNIRARCNNPRNRQYSDYGGRGIRVCDEWSKSFEAFLADMGERPAPHLSLDRIDNDGNYEPSNCRWATREEQQRNTRKSLIFQIHGESMALPEIVEKTGLPYHRIYRRLREGRTIQQAIGDAAFRAMLVPRRDKVTAR